MKTFTHRMPDDLHEAARLWLERRPWANQTEMINEAVARLVEFKTAPFVRDIPMSLDDCVSIGWLAEDDAKRLRTAIIRGGERIVITGEIGSGRTTLTRALVHEYQKVRSFPRRAMILAIDKDEYISEDITPVMTIEEIRHTKNDSERVADLLEQALNKPTPDADIIFIDVDVDMGKDDRIKQLFKTSRKSGVTLVVSALDSDMLVAIYNNATIIVETRKNERAKVEFNEKEPENRLWLDR